MTLALSSKIFRRALILGAVVLGLAFAGFQTFTARNAHAASTEMNITGNAWTQYIGWLQFNGTSKDGTTWGVQENSQTGQLSGYAYGRLATSTQAEASAGQSNAGLGWVSFNDNGCPVGVAGTGPTTGGLSGCQPRVDFTTGKVQGWARACSVFANKNSCAKGTDVGGSNAIDPNLDAGQPNPPGYWDGWIHLSGSNYQVVQKPDCSWTGYAWGSNAIGAIHMNGSNYQVEGTDPSVCGGHQTVNIAASPTTVSSGGSTTLTWTSTGVSSCTLNGSPVAANNQTGLTEPSLTTGTHTYTLTCSKDASGSPLTTPVSDSTTVTVTSGSLSCSVTNTAPTQGSSFTFNASTANGSNSYTWVVNGSTYKNINNYYTVSSAAAGTTYSAQVTDLVADKTAICPTVTTQGTPPAGACSGGSLSGKLTPSTTRVKSGSTVDLTYSISNVSGNTSCSIIRTNSDGTQNTVTTVTNSGSTCTTLSSGGSPVQDNTPGGITGQTVYSIECGGTPVAGTKTVVNVDTKFNEF